MKLFGDRVFVIGEIGPNHQGDLKIALQLIDALADAGADCAKFQVKTPHMSLPPHLWNVVRETPWGPMTYLEYRQKIELSPADYVEVVKHCNERGLVFSASPWDRNSADKVYELGAPFIKIASASVTNLELVRHIGQMKRPVVMSTGMCTLPEIKAATRSLYTEGVTELSLLACTSTYPAKTEDLNLSRIYSLQDEFPMAVVGYSGHEPGLWTTLCAVAMGAKVIERHITLDRAMVGSDHAASVEPHGFKTLVREIRNFETAFGSDEIRVLDCEKASIERLRGPQNPHTGASQEVIH